MSSLPVPVLERARRQYGLVTDDQLRIAGVSVRTQQRLIASGALVRVIPKVARVASHSPAFEQECLAVCLAYPELVISGPSAGQLMNLRRMPRGLVHVLWRGSKLDLPGIVVHRTTVLGDGDIVHRADGIRLLKPARLVPDLARFLDDTDLESVIEQLIDRGQVTIPMLIASAKRLRAPGRDGTLRLARVLQSRPAWMKPKDSDQEVAVLREMRRRGVELVPQYEIKLLDGTSIHFDGADPERRFGVEVDHVTWHGGRIDAERDKRRDRQAARVGWTVARVTDAEVENDLVGVVDELLQIRAACPVVAPRPGTLG